MGLFARKEAPKVLVDFIWERIKTDVVNEVLAEFPMGPVPGQQPKDTDVIRLNRKQYNTILEAAAIKALAATVRSLERNDIGVYIGA